MENENGKSNGHGKWKIAKMTKIKKSKDLYIFFYKAS
jgi:hypothetical protein